MKKKAIRNSNIEFLRMFSMLLITLHHFSLWGQGDRADKLITNGHLIDAFKSLIYLPLGDIGVYIFVMITGFYLGNKIVTNGQSLRKSVNIYGKLYFYSVIFLFIGLSYHLPLDNFPNLRDPLMPFNHVPNILMSVFPIVFNHYWFVTAFVLLMLIVPYLNIVLNRIDKRQIQILLFISIVSTSIFPLLNNNVASESVGLGVVVTAYIIGMYIKKFCSLGKSSFGIGMLFAIINIILIYVITYYDITILKYRYIRIYTGFFALMSAVGIFLIFVSLKPRFNFILNKLAKHIFAVYLITENIFVIKPLWKMFSFNNITDLIKVNVFGLMAVLAIMLCACCIDIIRSQIFRMLSSLVTVTKQGIILFKAYVMSNNKKV